MRLGTMLVLIAVAGGCTPAARDRDAGAPHPDAADAGHATAPLLEGLGDWHHAVTTRSARAQRFFDQGLRLVYAFNHVEAVRAFDEAARLDPTCAMAYWGKALALGPNINDPMLPDREQRALEAIQKAVALREGASEHERAYIDALALRFRELRLRRDPACPVCGDSPTIRELRDLEGYCEAPASDAAAPDAATPAVLGPEEVRDRLAGPSPPVLVDVREDWEVALGTLPGALHIPLDALPGRWTELPPDREVVVYCHAGLRSARAAHWLRSRGLRRVASLDGGTEAWSALVDPTLPRY